MVTLPLTSLLGLLLTAFGLFVLYFFTFEGKLLGLLSLYLGGVLLLFHISSKSVLISLFFVGVSNCVVLASGHINIHEFFTFSRKKADFAFALVLCAVLLLLAFAMERKIHVWIPLPDSILLAVLAMLLNSLVLIALEQDLLCAFLYLQSIFFSFELLYLLLDGSVLIFVCLTGISMFLSLVGAYLNLPTESDTEEVEDIL